MLNPTRSMTIGYLFLLSFTLTSVSHAFDLSMLANEKEAVSHSYNRLELNAAKRKLRRAGKDIPQTAYRILGETLNELEKSKTLCDLPFYQSFTKKLSVAGISTSSSSILNILISWRSENLIDDLFFEIVEQLSAMEMNTPSKLPSAGDTKKAKKILAAQKIPVKDISGLYESYSDVSRENPGCSIDAWIRTATTLAPVSNYKTIHTMNALALENHMISQDAYDLIEMYRLNDVALWDLTLSKYLKITRLSKNKLLKNNKSTPDFKPNNLSSMLKDKNENMTYRKFLYSRFDATQVSMLADALQETIDRMDSTRVEVTFISKSGEKTIPFSARGQYLIVQDLLQKDISDLNKSMFFQGTPVTLIDLVTAGVETGMINGDVVEYVLGWDDLWNPDPEKRWQKLVNFGYTITGTATIFLPPPYNVISSVALVFISGLIYKKLHKQKLPGGAYDMF